ncbi:MAG: nickel-dependent lactate racemase [Planctomycetota bacterium]|nr:nickel-dependent lactate racemase [Planctomycetota bacterium]
MTTARVAYGAAEIDVTLPDAIASRVVAPSQPTAAGDPLGIVAKALDAPMDARPLGEAAQGAGTVALVVPDGTRPASASTYLLPIIARLARRGFTPDRMRIVIARGIHPATPRDQVEAMLGPEILATFRPVQSSPGTPDMNVKILDDPQLGPVRVHRHVAEADLVILTGSVAPHHLAGFGGGPKALVPGVADRDTVLAAHRLTLDSLVRPDGSIRSAAGTLAGNAFHAALLRVARAFGRTWLLNVVLDTQGKVAAAAAGEVGAAHAQAVEHYKRLFAWREPEPADLVIAGSRGAASSDLIQCHKTLLRAVAWAKPGAPIVWSAPAERGPGHGALLPWFTAGKPSRHLLALRKEFHPYGLTAYSIKRIAKDHPVYVVSEMSRDLLRPMGLLPCTDLQSAIDLACQENQVQDAVILPG